MNTEQSKGDIAAELPLYLTKAGNVRGLEGFAAYLEQAKPRVGKRKRAVLLAAYKMMLRDQYVDQLAASCGANPKVVDVERLMQKIQAPPSVVFSSPWRVHRLLKQRHPQLWSTADRTLHKFSFREEDRQLAELTADMLGLQVHESMHIVHRALLLASLRGEVNLIEILLTAKNMKLDAINGLRKAICYNLNNL